MLSSKCVNDCQVEPEETLVTSWLSTVVSHQCLYTNIENESGIKLSNNIALLMSAIVKLLFCAQYWHDERLTWNPGDYGNCTWINIPGNLLYLPDVDILNPLVLCISLL